MNMHTRAGTTTEDTCCDVQQCMCPDQQFWVKLTIQISRVFGNFNIEVQQQAAAPLYICSLPGTLQ